MLKAERARAMPNSSKAAKHAEGEREELIRVLRKITETMRRHLGLTGRTVALVLRQVAKEMER